MVSDHSRLPPPAGVALSLPIHPASLLRPGCRYRSRGACGQTVSPVRSGMTPTAAPQRGVGACRVDRGQERAITIRPSCGACGISRPRKPGPSTVHSAPPTPRRRSIQQLHSSPIIPIIVPSLLLFRIGVALSEPRSVRADSIPGSERHDTPLPRVSGAVGACRVDRGQERAITIRPSCGACEISRPRQPGPPTGT